MKKLFIAIALMGFSVSGFAFDESVKVSWSDAGTEDGYNVQVNASTCAAANLNNWSTVATPAADVLSVDVTVQDDATYCFRVQPVKNGQTGNWTTGGEIAVPASLAAQTIQSSLN